MSRGVLFFDQDSRILSEIRNGDQAGLVSLYNQNWKPIVTHVTRNGGSADDADDILQESVVIVWERIRAGTFEPNARLGTFLFGVARNLWLRRLARRRRELTMTGDPDLVSADEEEEEDERVEQVQIAFKQLGEPCRTLLLLYYWERLSMSEVALLVGFANADVAKAKKYQCKEQLRRLMTKAQHD